MAKDKRKRRFIVRIVADRCKGCGYCIEFCSKKALEASPEFNAKGYHPPVVTRPDECSGCLMCEMVCPDFAIWIEETDDASVEKAKVAQAGKD